MAGPFTKTAVQVFAGTDAAGKARGVNNHDAQVWGSEVERAFALFQAGGGVVFTSKAEADANLDYAANTMAWVTGDDDEAGLYQKQGASGGGSWVRVGDLPYSFIRAENAGAGTANAIQATTVDPIPQADGGALIALPIAADNTADAPTVSFNGGPALTISDAAGNPVGAGGLTAGMLINGYVVGDTFRADMGPRGWSPLLRVVNDGTRRVMELYDWTGGHGAKPSETGYVGPSGLTSDIAQATDVRGPEGPNGPGTGDMLKTQYDPQGIEGDAFSMANFTGRPKWYPRDLSSLLADTSLGYAAADPAGVVQAGDVIQTQAENYRFEVAASDASDEHVSTAGGVKLYVLRNNEGIVSVQQFAVMMDGGDDSDAMQRAFEWLSAGNRVLVAPPGDIRCAALVLTAERGSSFMGSGRVSTKLIKTSDDALITVENTAVRSALKGFSVLSEIEDTTSGIVVDASRTNIFDVYIEGMGEDGLQVTGGHLSEYANITSVGNGRDGVFFPIANIANSCRFGLVDSRVNGRNGLMIQGTGDPADSENLVGGPLVLQNNGGYGALIQSRSNVLTIYAENNNGADQIRLAGGAEGNFITAINGFVNDTTTTKRNLIWGRSNTGTSSAYELAYARMRQMIVSHYGYVGELLVRPSADREYIIEGDGTSSASTLQFGTNARNLNVHGNGYFRFGGSGTPEGRVAAPIGAIYTRTDGGAGSTLYVKESGSGSSGWVAK